MNVLYVVVNYLINEVMFFFNNWLYCGNCIIKVYVDGFDVFVFLNFFLLLEVGIYICCLNMLFVLYGEGELIVYLIIL